MEGNEIMDTTSVNKSPRFIVGLGASAGGLEALEAFFSGMPVDTGIAFVVIQHLAPDFKSLMDELLARRTTMAIHKSENEMKIEADSIYLIPPKKEMIIKDGALFLRDRNPAVGVSNLPIDIFFHSLAEDYKSNAIGIVFSGTGSDGSKGIAAIHEKGGLVLCQTPESASFDGMPNSAIATSMVDVVVNPNEMPSVLVDYIKHSSTFLDERRLKNMGDDHHIYTPIFNKLKEEYDVDFQYYKPATIGRRIERRMSLTRNKTVDDYIEFLSSEDNDELELLYRDLLIGVTQFFRDDQIWEYIENEILSKICEKCTNDEELRFWVPGCATGEEAYSMAILVHEWLTAHGKPINVRIFATDLHKDSLAIAGRGVYSQNSISNISFERSQRYLIETDDNQFEISPEIRRMVVFAQHNVLKDPPFTKIDLISCRNLLIYFMNTAQKRAITLFHFALRVNGYLFLGPSESLGDIKNEFEELHRRFKVYKKRRDIKLGDNLRNLQPNMPLTSGNILLREPMGRSGSIGGRDIHLIRAYDVLLQKYVPCSILIEQNGTLAYTFGDATDYLHTPKGVSSLNVLDVIHDDLRMAVSTGLQRTCKDVMPVSYGGIKVNLAENDIRIVRVTVQSLSEQKPSDYVLITFEKASQIVEVEQEEALLPADVVQNAHLLETDQRILSEQHVQQLEEELRYTKENLQATVEELETSNEELQATNEELMASNEELQSTNEELHSVNEELYTVNREHEEKIDQLTQLNDDMDNLMAATDIGTIFLDKNLKIRKFTPAAARQFSLISQDIGRPISHLNRNIEFDDFQNALESVRDTGKSTSYEVRNVDNRWYLMGLHPYLNERHETTGVVISFVEISLLKDASNQISQRNEDLQSFAYAISHDLNEPVRILANFTELLLKETEPHHNDDEKIRTISGHIKDASRRLRDMLDGTLRFSRIITQGQGFVEAKLIDSLEGAKLNIKQQLLENNVRIVCEKLPVLNCDVQQMTRVFQELISNSIQYRKDDEPPVIHIDYKYKEKEKEFVISYRDNGSGIHIENPERIFHIFFTAHHRKNDNHLGLGLAICKRIIERHGGSISYLYNPPGSEFIIHLPSLR